MLIEKYIRMALFVISSARYAHELFEGQLSPSENNSITRKINLYCYPRRRSTKF